MPFGPFKKKKKLKIPKRDLSKELHEITDAQIGVFPKVLNAERQYRPELAQLNIDVARDSILGPEGLLTLQEETLPQITNIREQQLLADMGLIDRYSDTVGGLYNQGRNRLLDILQTQAAEELELGGELSPEDIRSSQQAIRSAFTDRGLEDSNRAIFAEALGRDALRRDREDRARRFGFGAVQLKETDLDPYSLFFIPQLTPSSVLNQGANLGINARPTIFNPLDPAGMSVMTSNAEIDRFNAIQKYRASQQPGFWEQTLSMAGGLAGGYFGGPFGAQAGSSLGGYLGSSVD